MRSVWFFRYTKKGKRVFDSVCYEHEAYRHMRELKRANPHTEFRAENSDGTPYRIEAPLRDAG